MKRILIALALVWAAGGFAQSSFEINSSYVEKQLSALAADDMKGRKVFTAEIDLAADYIANDFQNAGLSYLPGLSGFKQEFTMFQIATKSLDISVAGEQLESAHVFGFYDHEKISWTESSDIEVFKITADEHFQTAFSEVRGKDVGGVVFVDKAHKAIYARYQQYFSRGSTKFELNNAKSLVFVLVDDVNASTFSINIENTVEEKQLANVVGMIEGNIKNEIVLFSAHYDHIGFQKSVEGDSIANGANDDASGTVAVMALANYFKGKPKPERSIYFVAFTAEEVGGYGSQYFSKQLNPDEIVAMFNIEMIGKPAVEGPNSAWITGFDRSTFGELMQKSTEGTKYKFYADPYPDQNLFYRSDNATLAKLGVPAHSISTTPIDVDKDYHQVTDEMSTLNIDHLTNTIKAIVAGAEGIISGEDTPTRVAKEED